jgi:hypothetical protein
MADLFRLADDHAQPGRIDVPGSASSAEPTLAKGADLQRDAARRDRASQTVGSLISLAWHCTPGHALLPCCSVRMCLPVRECPRAGRL